MRSAIAVFAKCIVEGEKEGVGSDFRLKRDWMWGGEEKKREEESLRENPRWC